MQVCYNTNEVFGKWAKCCNCGFLALHGAYPFLSELVKTMQDYKAAKDIGLYSSECIQSERDQIAGSKHPDPSILTCARYVWSGSGFKDKPKDAVFQFLNSNRKCPYFFPYNPRYSPLEHRELQRDAKNQRLLIIGMLLAALIGAAAAIVAQVLAR